MLEEGRLFLYQSKKIIEDQEVLEYVNTLGKEGWELVNVVDEIGNERPTNQGGKLAAAMLDFAIAGLRVTTMTQDRTVTLGYYLWFRRSYEPITCKNCQTENSLNDLFCCKCGVKLD